MYNPNFKRGYTQLDDNEVELEQQNINQNPVFGRSATNVGGRENPYFGGTGSF